MTKKKKVIIVTDGDTFAQKAVETAVKKIGGRCISRSAGNPTPLLGSEIIALIKEAKHEPVVIMVDDRGHNSVGKGEKALYEVVNHSDIEVLGIVAVASNTEYVNGIEVDFSITKDGKIVHAAVDKNGEKTEDKILYGDTVDILKNCNIPLIIGIGDPGKMEGNDDVEIGAPILTKALEEIINRSEINNEAKQKNR